MTTISQEQVELEIEAQNIREAARRAESKRIADLYPIIWPPEEADGPEPSASTLEMHRNSFAARQHVPSANAVREQPCAKTYMRRSIADPSKFHAAERKRWVFEPSRTQPKSGFVREAVKAGAWRQARSFKAAFARPAIPPMLDLPFAAIENRGSRREFRFLDRRARLFSPRALSV